jgi:biopolymer transport protein ExbD
VFVIFRLVFVIFRLVILIFILNIFNRSSAVKEAESGKKQSSNRTKMSMINTPATGRIFVNTVMMGELPLSVASLTFNEETVCTLLEHGAKLSRRVYHGHLGSVGRLFLAGFSFLYCG